MSAWKMARVKERGGARKKGKETLAGQTPGVWKLPTWPVMPECAHRHLMLSSADLLYGGVSLSISLNLKLAPVPFATPKWPIWQSWITSAHVQRRERSGSKLVSFTKGFSKHPHILAIFKVDSEYLRFPFKAKVDYFILHSILVYSFVIFLIFFAMNKRRRSSEASLLN